MKRTAYLPGVLFRFILLYSNTASKQKEKQQQFFGPKRNIQRIFWPVKRVQAATAPVGWNWIVYSSQSPKSTYIQSRKK